MTSTRVLYMLTDEISSVLVRGQLRHLIENGFEVTVGTRVAPPNDGDLTPPASLARGVWDRGVTVAPLPFVREPSPLADLRALVATVRLIRRLRPEIVNASTPKAGLLGMLAAWTCRVPVRLYVVRGFRFETATGWRRRLFRSLESVAMRCANYLVFNSRSLLGVGEREGIVPAGRGEVIFGGSGNGIDVTRFSDDVLPTRSAARQELGVPDDAVVVGFVGRFTRDKGIADLIGVFTSSLGARPDVWLLLVGRFEDGDPVPPAVRDVIESADRIVTVPWLEHTGVAYRAMDMLAFPSAREGLPNVPIEAQLCGVPVVAFEATGTVDAIADGVGGVLVPVGDADALGAVLADLIDDPERRRELGAAGSEWVAANFDQRALWDGLVDRYRLWSPA
jgi:glycosyltransferase involved in cell wall biosynthesis